VPKDKFTYHLLQKYSFYLTEHHAMKEYWGSVGIAPRILWSRN